MTEAKPVDVIIYPHQREPLAHIMSGKPSITCLTWGRGLGKSTFIRIVIWLLIYTWFGKKRAIPGGEMTGIRIHLVMPTLKQFKQVHGSHIERENNTEWKFLGGKLDRTDWSIKFPDGSFFIPVPGEIATAERGRGFRGDVTIFDEADDIDKSVRNAITQPWFSEPFSLGIEILSGTPKRGRYGLLYEMYERGQSDDPKHAHIKSWRAKSPDYPKVVNSNLIKQARDEMPRAVFAREYEADFDSAEGLVYAFDESIHVAEPPDTRYFTEFFVCGDHGMQDPGVILLCGLEGRGDDSVLWVLDEVYASNKPNHEWDAIARERFAGLDGYFDPSRPDRIIDYRRAGIKCKDVDNSIEAGVARVADLLVIHQTDPDPKNPDAPIVRWTRLKVAPRCVNTRWEFVNYRRKKDPRNPDQYLEDIVDKNNHCLVGETLVTTERGAVQICNVTTEDRVLTRNGWRNVRWSGKTFESRKLWRVATENGALVGTPDHRVWTENRGWARLDSLRYGDIVLSCQSTAKALQNDTAAKSSEDIQNPQIQTFGGTGAHNSDGICTGSSGKTITGQSPKASTFTTSTETRQIAALRIFSAFLGLTTSLLTVRLQAQKLSNGARSTLLRLCRWLASGIRVQKVGVGILKTAGEHKRQESLMGSPANSAGSRLDQSSGVPLDSAQTPAGQLGEESPVLITSSESAQSARPGSLSISTQKPELAPSLVLASYPAERSAAVYDLTVDGDHEFFANGLLVHNSMDSLRYGAMGRFGPVTFRGNYRNEAPGR